MRETNTIAAICCNMLPCFLTLVSQLLVCVSNHLSLGCHPCMYILFVTETERFCNTNDIGNTDMLCEECVN